MHVVVYIHRKVCGKSLGKSTLKARTTRKSAPARCACPGYFDTSKSCLCSQIHQSSTTGSSRIFDTNTQSIDIKMVGCLSCLFLVSGCAMAMVCWRWRMGCEEDVRSEELDAVKEEEEEILPPSPWDRGTRRHSHKLQTHKLTPHPFTVGRRRGSPAGGRGRRGGRGAG